MRTLVRSFALGLAVGGRSTLALSVPVHAALHGRDGALPRVGRALVGAAVAGEIAADKLPTTPSRLGHPQLEGRLAAGAVGAVALAVVHRDRWPALVPAAVAGLAGTWAGAVLGASWRAAAARSGSPLLQPDARAAAVEDAAVLLLGRVLARR